MIKDFVNDKNLQIAMTEYNDNSINRDDGASRYMLPVHRYR